ncbi:unnamed protein product [Euphydryas editha]|uniref:Uncharacterized protein n=1 Tax=Euphydryas editha TaxID=104508 RepID=A0AAU9V850_EUPED|nr:unnamed protein product [Euphydryas editha]
MYRRAYHIITSIDVKAHLREDNNEFRRNEPISSWGQRTTDHGRDTEQRGHRRDTIGRRLVEGIDECGTRPMGRIAQDIEEKAKKSRHEQRKKDESLAAQSVDFLRSDDDDTDNARAEPQVVHDANAASTSKAQMASTMDCTTESRLHNTERNITSPWKVIALYTGTKRHHYHLIYISTAKNWGHNSKLGKNIRFRQYKCSAITCIQCLLEYITTGPNRETLRHILRRSDYELAKCVTHQLGLATNTMPRGPLAITEGGDDLFQVQGSARADYVSRMVGSNFESDENVLYDTTNELRNFGEPSDELGNELNAIQRRGRGRRNSSLPTIFTQQN